MVMWIVLGSLIGVVVIFLVVTSVLDRKKNKKIVIQKEQLTKEVEEAGVIISKEVTKAVKNNEELLKKFVPSVGQLKMSDINKKARADIKKILDSRNYKLLKHVDKRQEEFDQYLLPLYKEKSNNWAKRNQDSIKFFKNYKPTIKKEETNSKKRKTSKKTKKGNK